MTETTENPDWINMINWSLRVAYDPAFAEAEAERLRDNKWLSEVIREIRPAVRSVVEVGRPMLRTLPPTENVYAPAEITPEQTEFVESDEKGDPPCA